MSCRSRDIQCRKYRDLEIPVKGQSRSQKWYHLKDWLWFPISVLFVHKTHRFWDIRLVSTWKTWNPGYGPLKVIGADTYRSATYDFLSMFHGNDGPISYCFWDKWRFQSKVSWCFTALLAQIGYHAIEVRDVSHRAGGQHKYHAIKQWKNTINTTQS